MKYKFLNNLFSEKLLYRNITAATRRSFRKCEVSFQKNTNAEVPKQPNEKKPELTGAFFVAAHAGSGYCRAALVNDKGGIVRFVGAPCRIYQNGIFREMSSELIWTTLVKCIKSVTDQIDNGQIQGIGFVGTPALVCLDEKGNPVTVSTSRDPHINVILYYDNRSALEVKKINITRHNLLRYFGEKAEPELQESKLIWLKNNLKEDCWDKVGHFMELTDFLTWKATGSLIRSSSSLVSQWTYELAVNGKEGWNAQYLSEIGIPEVANDNFKKIGSEIQHPGIKLPNGLLEKEATAMGLRPQLPVATGMPDGLSGCLGLVGCRAAGVPDDVDKKLCAIFGTKAAAHFILSHDPHFIKAIKGPLRDSVLPNMWLNQGGQITAASALDYIVDNHPANPSIRKQMGAMHIHKYLNKVLKMNANKKRLQSKSFLTKNLHVLPDYNGNKSPIGNALIRGMISGLSINPSQKSLALLYLATLQGITYGVKHILDTLTQNEHKVKSVLIGGSLGKNSTFVQTLKEVIQLPIVIPNEPRSKIIGAAILGGIAANHFRDFHQAIQEMSGTGELVEPETNKEIIKYQEQKYEVFLKMYDHQLEYRRIMGDDKQKNLIADVKQ